MISKKQIGVLLILLFTICSNTFAQSGHKNLLAGDKFYRSGDYQLAEENYRKAREQERELKSTFNLGNTVYNQERYEEAIDHYTAATQLAPDNTKRSDAFYNLGNSLVKNGNLEESIDAYKEAIQLNSNNEEAKYNLLVAKRALRDAQQQEQQQQQQDGQEGENQDQQDQQEQEQEQQDQQEQKQEQQDQQDQQEQEEKQDSLNQNPPSQSGGEFDTSRLDKQMLDSLDAMKLLQVMDNEEKKVQEKMKKFNSKRKKPDKDW